MHLSLPVKISLSLLCNLYTPAKAVHNYSITTKGGLIMHRFTGGLVSGLAVGMAIGMGFALTDDKYRRRMAKDSRRAMRRAGHLFDDFCDKF